MYQGVNIYELSCRYDARISFYGKAHVSEDDHKITLLSYLTPVVIIENSKVTLLDRWDESMTTLRHVKEFLKQYGYKADSKSQIASDYCN